MAVGLIDNELVFEFPEVGKEAELRIRFHRTLRIPDDGRTYGLPPSLGAFPLREIGTLRQERLPAHWPKRGGVVMPLWQSEAMWMSFHSRGYPFAVKIAAGKINAVSGKAWTPELDHDEQDFVQVPGQPWLDGFCVEKGQIRQFIAIPLGAGYSAEEQITGKAEHGGVQIIVYPLKAEAWERRRPPSRQADWFTDGVAEPGLPSLTMFSKAPSGSMECSMAPDMGLGSGGRMKQDIYQSSIGREEWSEARSRCFVAIANSLTWQHIAGEAPPHMAPTAADYTAHGMPWFDYYAEKPALGGSKTLAGVKSVTEIGTAKGENPLPENQSFDPAAATTLEIGPKRRIMACGARAMAEAEF